VVTKTRGAIISRMQSIIGDVPMFTGDNEIVESEFAEALAQAVKRFSNSVPHVVVEDEVGDSGQYYPLTNLTSWEDDWSRIIRIDYDVGSRVSGDELQQFLKVDDKDWLFYRDSTTRYLFFPKMSPTSSITYRVTYTTFHTLSDAESTIPTRYEEAILYLGVSRLARIIQTHVEKGMESSAGADYPALRNAGSGMSAIAIVYEDMYEEEMGGIDTLPATAFRETDQRYMAGDPYLFHAGSLR
jgi:hypothetical protein